jgi:hypothetical protein
MLFPRTRLLMVSLFAGVVVVGGSFSSVRAAETHSLVIAANDGYGVEDCLAEAGECGQVVADAWCEAHGHGAAVSFGRASKFFGLVAAKVAATDEPYVVNCSD